MGFPRLGSLSMRVTRKRGFHRQDSQLRMTLGHRELLTSSESL